MSRCFPFPPPGYERKTTIDTAESLTKEKRKEKKDEKKRDKEKREGKERKHKDRNDEKHREKKTHKEKHRHKKDKDRDKETNKDNSRTSNDKVLEEQAIYDHVANYGEISEKARPNKDSKSTEAFDKKIRGRADGNQMVQNVTNISPAKNAGVGGMVDKERRAGAKTDKQITTEKRIRSMEHMVAEGAINNSTVNNFITPEQRSIDTGGIVEKGWAADVKMGRYPPANGARIGAMGNMLVERATASNALGAEQRRHIGTGGVVEKERSADAKTDRDRFANQKRTMVIGNWLEGANGNNVGNSSIIAERRRDFVPSGMEEGEVDNKIKEANKWIKQEKAENLEANNAKKKERHKDKDHDKSNRKKNRDKRKEKKKDTEKIREKEEDKERKSADAGKKEQDASSFKTLHPVQDVAVKCAGFDGDLKRKQINGFLHENDFQPNKLPRTDSSSHLALENGRKLGMHHHIATSCTSEWDANVSNGVLEGAPDKGGHGTNGVVKSKPQPQSQPHQSQPRSQPHQSQPRSQPQPQSQPHQSQPRSQPQPQSQPQSQSQPQPQPTTPTAATTCEVSVKQQHPDSWSPSQLLSLPKMAERTEAIDEEWLFGNNDVRRQARGETTAMVTSQVWDKALKLDEAEVLALPYVIPY